VVTIDQVTCADVFTFFVKWNPKIVTSVQFGMSIIPVEVPNAPSANARDFRMLTFALFAATYVSRVSCSFRISAVEVRNTVTSFAYAITAVFALLLPI